MSTQEMDLETALQWKELGFYYLVDEKEMVWTLRGDRAGLLKFVNSLREYAKNPVNHVIGEHEHFGPYFYLKVTTRSFASITDDGLTGMPEDFLKLASLIERYLATPAQKSFVIGKDFAPTATFSIRFEIEEDGFDPSSADPGITHRS